MKNVHDHYCYFQHANAVRESAAGWLACVGLRV